MLMQNEIPGVGRRLAALVVDMLVLALANQAIWLGLREVTGSVVVLVVLDYVIMLFYSVIFLSSRGQTPGKIMTRLRVIGAGGGVVTIHQAFVRALLKWTPVFAVLIAQTILSPLPTDFQVPSEAIDPELITPAVEESMAGLTAFLVGAAVWLYLLVTTRRHPDGQAPHDRVAGTYVIRL